MIERRKPTTLDKLRVMVRQAVCPLCGQKLGALDDTEFDHERALVNGGEDTLDNLRAVHVDCHKVKTHGNGATNRGSDRGEAAKTRRLVEKRLEREATAPNLIDPISELEPVAKKPKSGNSPNKRKLQSANRWPPKKPKVPYRRRGV
jgi:hypothetical protein